MFTHLGYGRRQPRGTALIVSMVLVLLLSGLAVALFGDMQVRTTRASYNMEDVKSFEAAEAGLDSAIKDLNNGGTGCLGVGWTDTNKDGIPQSSEIPADGYRGGIPDTTKPATDPMRYPNDGLRYTGNSYIAPKGGAFHDSIIIHSVKYYMARPQPAEFDFYKYSVKLGDTSFYTWAVPWQNDGIDNDGSGVADDASEKDWYTIYATGYCRMTNGEGKFTTVEAIVQRISYAAAFNVPAALTIELAPFTPAP